MTGQPTLAPALDFGWTMKPLSTAETRLRVLRDGRLEATIVHDLVRGTTPEMIHWWFTHIGGDMTFQGQVVPRYRVWHPQDHIHWSLEREGEDGGASAGAKFRIVEAFGRDPAYRIDVTDTVEKLDDTGIRLSNQWGGVEVSSLEHTFTARAGGTLYHSRLLVGMELPLARRAFNSLIRPRLFSEAMARAWLKHNVEEVGNLEFFLPDLFEQEHRTDPTLRKAADPSSPGLDVSALRGQGA